ncbi:MAG: hypothetical protein FD174_1097 [Geobacteraceae bacterium]|nr:MAG: hypothetical protein FD174_1097 [Geobacteraceae bacterium]
MKIREISKTEADRVRLKPFSCNAPAGDVPDKSPC